MKNVFFYVPIIYSVYFKDPEFKIFILFLSTTQKQ